MSEWMSVSQTAKYLKVGNQAVYQAIKLVKLKAEKIEGIFRISKTEADAYIERRYDHRFSIYKGGLKFDPEKGEMSTKQVAKSLGIPVQTAYYMLRNGKLKYTRKGYSYVVIIKDIEYAKKILKLNQPPVVPVRDDRIESHGESRSLGSTQGIWEEGVQPKIQRET